MGMHACTVASCLKGAGHHYAACLDIGRCFTLPYQARWSEFYCSRDGWVAWFALTQLEARNTQIQSGLLAAGVVTPAL